MSIQYIALTGIVLFPNLIMVLATGVITPVYRYIYPTPEEKQLSNYIKEIKEIHQELKELKEQDLVIIDKNMLNELKILKEKKCNIIK